MKEYLDYEDFKDFVKSLSNSQGFYTRLYKDLLEIEKNQESLEEFKEVINNIKAKDTLDFVFWLEC